MMAGTVVLIEGLDLAGKSTLVANLARELASRGIPVRVSRNALCPENPIAALADELRRAPEAGLLETGALFLAAHAWDARHWTPPPNGTIHIQDSCWLRTLAYHTFHATPGIPALLQGTMSSFPRFDAAVFLTAGIDERRRRLAQREREQPRNNDANDRMVLTNPTQQLALEKLLRDLAGRSARAVNIDTSGLPAADLMMRVIQIVLGR
jgi:thymidylate kinase